jgi:hypothetical protein
MVTKIKNKKIAVIGGDLQLNKEDKYWEEIGKRCSVNTYNFWEDLKEQFKKEFILNKRQ